MKVRDCLVPLPNACPSPEPSHEEGLRTQHWVRWRWRPVAWRGGGIVWSSVEHPALHCDCSTFLQGGWKRGEAMEARSCC